MAIDEIIEETRKLTKEQLEIKIQLTCEEIQETYITKNEVKRQELVKLLGIYNNLYDAR